MTDLRKLSDAALLKKTEQLVRQERGLLMVILRHLNEIERRRSYGGYGSLHEYAVKQLKYSEPQASRRVSALELLREIPQLAAKIEAGDVNLTHILIAKSVFTHEKKKGRGFSSKEKHEVLEAMAGLPTRQAQRVAFSYAPEVPPRRDEIRALPNGRNVARIDFSDETLAKIEALKGLRAHKNPYMSMDELINDLCDLGMQQWSPAREPKRPKTGKRPSKASIQRAIWRRDKSACTICSSTHALEEDHIIPRSLGGEYSLENIRLLCRKCNQRAAIEKLGQDKMDPHLNPPFEPKSGDP